MLIVISNVEILFLFLLNIELRHALFAVNVWNVNYATSRGLIIIIIIILFSSEYQKIYSTHTHTVIMCWF